MTQPGSGREIRTRLFVLPDLQAGVEPVLPAAIAHYLGRVLRLAPGASVRVFNGRDGEWLAQVLELDRKAARLAVRTRLRAQPPAGRIVLAFAPIRRQRMDWLLEKAVELGAARLQPVITAFAQARELRADRAEAIVREAMEQCERLDLPRIGEPLALEGFLAGWPEGAPLLFCDETGSGLPARQVLPGLAEFPDARRVEPPPVALLVGPEGGFSPAERERLRGHAAVRALDLGPRVLRAETAALAGLALLSAWLDDPGREPE